MNRRPPIRIDASWTPLPGLFTVEDLAGIEGLEVFAVALVLRGTEVLYGVYVRDLERCLGTPKPFVSRPKRPSIEPAPPAR